MQNGEELRATIEDATVDGKSVARVDGMVVFVRGGVPGDQVLLRVQRTKKRYAEAALLRVLEPSPSRVTPRCRYFGECGGCTWQQVDYGAQLAFKRQQVVDALERIGGFGGVSVNPTLASEHPFFYRNKMEFSFGSKWLSRQELDRREASGVPIAPEDSFALGLHPFQRFDKVIDLEECWLQSETSAAIVNAVRKCCLDHRLPVWSTESHTGYLRNVVVREGKRTGEIMVNIVTHHDDAGVMNALCDALLQSFPGITTIINNITERVSQVATGEFEKVYRGPGFITERIGTRTYRISANSFFQTNTAQAERLYDTVRRMAGITSGDVVFDLYSGTGTIALHLAEDAREVIGIESVASAVEDARRNARENGVTNCTFILGDLKERLTRDTQWQREHALPNVVVVDPPRAGMHEKVVHEIVMLAPSRIVYVSCNPATQARDLAVLCKGGSYQIAEVQPVDMFPHTHHVECVVALRGPGSAEGKTTR